MKTIYKYLIPHQGELTYTIPKTAQFLKIMVQNGKPRMWWLVDSESELTDVKFAVHGTGQDLGDMAEYRYLDSFMLLGGDLVFHMFQIGNVAPLEISHLGLSTRAESLLAHAGVTTVEDLLTYTPVKLSLIPGMGGRSIQNIRERLSILGFSLKGDR